MLTIEVHPEASASRREAQNATQQLYLELKMLAPEAVIEKQETAAIAEGREVIAGLTTLVLAGVKLGVFTGMFQIWKTWLSKRPKAEITLRAKNGAELKISNATPEQAIKLFEEQSKLG
jgi:hypothetical protein